MKYGDRVIILATEEFPTVERGIFIEQENEVTMVQLDPEFMEAWGDDGLREVETLTVAREEDR